MEYYFFYSSGNKVSMKWVNDKDLDKFIEFVNKNVEGSNNSLGLIDQATHSDNDLQPLEKLKIKRVIRYGCYYRNNLIRKTAIVKFINCYVLIIKGDI